MQIKKKEQIKTERLVIRPYLLQDVDGLVNLLTNSEITKTFMVPEFDSLEQAENLAKKLVSFSQVEDTGHLEYGIYLDGKIIGFINDCGIEEEEIEIGYVIHPDYQGHGYATEAVKAILLELQEMGFQKVTAGYFSENKASYHVMKKCGMTQTEYTDEEEYRGERHLCRYCEIHFKKD
ncbi:MAG: GNAT family N-acetyltransferase [Roseburia sp.]|nr:GNAT family N-acetyltransferase [Roseburia sp.]